MVRDQPTNKRRDFFSKKRLANGQSICITPLDAAPKRVFPGSSAVEHSTVNRQVAGSNPARGAISFPYSKNNANAGISPLAAVFSAGRPIVLVAERNPNIHVHRPMALQEKEIAMRKFVLIAAAAGLAATGAIAQESTVSGAAGGAVTGAIVGGPIGAAVGGIVGAAAGTAIDPPPERVITYVREQPVPAQPVVVEREVVVGQPLPQTVVLTPVPEAPEYAYTYVNERRVIVDPNTYTVVQVID
jgi:hypothetical protein